MSIILQLKNGTNLQLEPKAFANGGEGDLYRISNPINFQNQVVKIYKPEKRTKDRENKTDFLATNPPTLKVHDGHHSVIWVNEPVYENGKFCGFTMPFAKGEKLELLCHPKLPPTLTGEWSKFDFQSPKSIELRLKLCFNIAVALYHIHKLNSYVLVDMKPENIMVQPNGLISLIDIDSVAVVKNNKVIFPAPVATPEYTPPEYYKGIKLDGEGMNETWDRFSMSVIFYRLLCGIHPFTGSCVTPYEKCNGLADMVRNGLFPNGLRSSYFKVVPPPHNRFKTFESIVQQLFKRTFNEGHDYPNNRPSADEWCRSLSPQQVIQINRPLPSSRIAYPIYNYSRAIIYNPNTEFDLPRINYVSPKSPKSLKSILQGLFRKTKYQQLIDLVNKNEYELKQKEKQYEIFSAELQDIITEFSKAQESILVEEKMRVEKLKNMVLFDISSFDNKAKELYIQEASAIKGASTLFTNSSTDLENKIRQVYLNILGNRFENHEVEKSVLQKEINKIEMLQQTEINNLINNPTKLSKYKIEDASIPNFGDTINSFLKAAGILTAADFIDITSSGQLINRSGRWIKVNGIGWSRAYDLREWQRKLELKENQIIISNVKQSHHGALLAITKNVYNTDTKFKKDIHPYQVEYNKEKMIYDENKAKLNEVYKAKLEEIKIKYEKEHMLLLEDTKVYIKTISPKARIIALEVEKELNDNFNKHIAQFASKKIEINNFTSDLNLEINRLTTLHQELQLQKN